MTGSSRWQKSKSQMSGTDGEKIVTEHDGCIVEHKQQVGGCLQGIGRPLSSYVAKLLI